MKRKALLFAVLLLLLAGAGVFFLIPSDPISKPTYDRIKLGMTEKEVIDLVGCLPGTYVAEPDEASDWVDPSFDTEGEFPQIYTALDRGNGRKTLSAFVPNPKCKHEIVETKIGECVYWQRKDRELLIAIDLDGKVFFKHFGQFNQSTFLDKIRRWLHL